MGKVQRLVSPIWHRLFNINRNSKHPMELKYIVYITINLCNGKFYIGVHKTNPDVFDGYIGCGIYRQADANEPYPFHRAVKKYGYENFKRTTIKIFPYTEEGKRQALDLESTLVNETLIKSKSVYNVAIGGGGCNINCYKRVYMFDLKGEYLRSFQSVRDAALFIGQSDVTTVMHAIRNNCEGSTNSSFGYFWSYKKEFTYEKNKKMTPVAQYTVSGKFIRHFDSISEAEAELHLNSVHQAIIKGYLCGNYQWKYYNGDNSDIPALLNMYTKNKMLPIIMLDKSGNVIKEYASVNECVEENPDLSSSQINRVLKNTIKSHKGYCFKYKDEDIV